jgi:hypothetical protein
MSKIPKSLPDNLPECPDTFTTEWGIQFLKALGADTSKVKNSWCWKEFNEHFKEYQKLFEKYLRNAKTGNPAWAAYLMHKDCGSSKKWAEKVIKNAKTGNPAWAAYYMYKYFESSKKWAEKVIKNAKTGNPREVEHYLNEENKNLDKLSSKRNKTKIMKKSVFSPILPLISILLSCISFYFVFRLDDSFFGFGIPYRIMLIPVMSLLFYSHYEALLGIGIENPESISFKPTNEEEKSIRRVAIIFRDFWCIMILFCFFGTYFLFQYRLSTMTPFWWIYYSAPTLAIIFYTRKKRTSAIITAVKDYYKFKNRE